MSKLGIYITVLILSLSMAYAHKSVSQNKALKNVAVILKKNESGLIDVLKEIERSSQFKFAYVEKDLKAKSLKLEKGNWNLEELLKEISSQTNTSFLRVNQTITIKEAENGLPVVEEETAQKVTITGVIKDENNEPLPGVNVVLKGTNIGTVTDIDGKYSIDVEGNDAVLVFTSVGYTMEEIMVGDQSVIDLVLIEDITSLQEIIVVGYDTQVKDNVIGAVSQVKAAEYMENRPITDVKSGLVGSTPGVRIEQGSGAPGTAGSIKIRGQSSIQGAGNVLIIVDGVQAQLDDVDPNVIQDITVLKDASAAAIYGNRAANGVVLITTKVGKRDQPMKVNYSFNMGFQNPTKVPKVVNSVDYMTMMNKARYNEAVYMNNGSAPEPTFSDEQIEAAKRGEIYNTDWADIYYGNRASQMNHSLNLTGGTKKTGYLISLGYLNQDGISAGKDNYKKYNSRVKLNTDLNDWLHLSNNTAITYRDKDKVPVVTGDTYRALPIYPVKLADGTLVVGDGGNSDNPLTTTLSGSYNYQKRLVMESQMSALIDITKDLSFEQKVAIKYENELNEDWTTGSDYVTLNLGDNGYIDTTHVSATSTKRKYKATMLRNTQINAQSLLKYKKSLGLHGLKVLVGFETFEYDNYKLVGSRENFLFATSQGLDLGIKGDEEVGTNNLGSTSNNTGETSVSYFGRFNYDYDGKYLLEVNFRRDASSKFLPAHRWGNFPSVSLGWNIGKESFIANNFEFVNMFKLRASWGELGDANAGKLGLYDWRNIVSTTDGYPWPDGNQSGLTFKKPANPLLTWETAVVRNFGMDMSLFNDKIEFAGEYYINDRKDILLSDPTIPLEFGLKPPSINGAQMRSWGYEFSMTHRNTIGDFGYSVSLNYSNYKNKIIDLGNSQPTIGGEVVDEGLPVNSRRGFLSDGFFETREELDAYKNSIDDQTKIQPYVGAIRFKDVNGDGKINNDDRVIYDDNQPNHLVGGRISLKYKDFNLSFIMAGVLERKVMMDGNKVDQHFARGVMAPFEMHKLSFDPDNASATRDAEFPLMQAGTLAYENCDFWMKKAAYIRMKNINLTYNAKKLINKALPKINGFNVYAAVENPFLLWTNYFAADYGWDPELGSGAVDYPLSRTVAFGFNINF